MLEEELNRPATRRDLLALEPRFDSIDRRFDELRRHFDSVAEQFTTEFKNLFDWTQATTTTMGQRLDRIEDDYGTRLTSVEIRLTKLEIGPKKKKRPSTPRTRH